MWVKPGASTITFTPVPRSSSWTALREAADERLRRAVGRAAAASAGTPPTDETLITPPRPRSTIGPSAAWVSRTSATTLSRISAPPRSIGSVAEVAARAEARVVDEQVDRPRRGGRAGPRPARRRRARRGRRPAPRPPRRASASSPRRERVGAASSSRATSDEVVAARRERRGRRPRRCPADAPVTSATDRLMPLIAARLAGSQADRVGDRGGRRLRRCSPTSTSLIARCGSLSPWPVTVHTTVSPARDEPCSLAASSPATDAADAGSTNTPSSAATQAVGLEDLRVGDLADVAARLVARGDRLAPGGRVADLDRGGDRLGVRAPARPARSAPRPTPASRASAAAASRAPGRRTRSSPASTR